MYIEGGLRTRKWQDKEGKDRYTTEIIARDMQMLGGRGGGGGGGAWQRGGGGEEPRRARPAAQEERSSPPPAEDSGGFDDEFRSKPVRELPGRRAAQ